MAEAAEHNDAKKEAILVAARERFLRHGFRRTSMDDIAKAARISRPALYLHFENKEDIFRSLSQALHEAALGRAEAALKREGAIETRLIAAFEGWSLEFVELAHGFSHAGELLDASHEVGADISHAASERFQRLLGDALRRGAADEELDLARAGLSAPRAAELLALAARGQKQPGISPAVYRKRVRALVRLFAAGAATPGRRISG